jgi:hypothetical protein
MPARTSHLRLADVAPQPALWLWPGRIPRGAVSLLVGDPGRGKSLIALDMAARVTTGRPWPGDGPDALVDDPGDVLLLSAEDSLSRIAHARLHALGADLSRVYVLNAGLWRDGTQREPTLQPEFIWAPTTFGLVHWQSFYALKHDANALKTALEALPQCRLVVIDPITAYLDVTTIDFRQQARQHVTPLATLADASGAAVVALAHREVFLESSGEQREQLRALATIARAIHLVDRLPDDPRQRVLAPIKNNLGEPQAPLAFTVEPAWDGSPTIHWLDAPAEFTADDLLASRAAARDRPASRVTEIDRAVAWLQGALAAGPVSSRDLIARAEACGINDRGLNRARAKLGVRATKQGSAWICNLPPKSEEMEGGQLLELSALSALSPLAGVADDEPPENVAASNAGRRLLSEEVVAAPVPLQHSPTSPFEKTS